MNGVINPGPSGLQRVGQLLDLVLGLGQSHAVTGHDDHTLGAGQQPGGLGVVVASGLGLGGCGRGLPVGAGDQRTHGLGRVAQHHDDAGPGVQGVGHARVTGFFVIVADDDGFGLVRFENGHAINGRALGGVGRRIEHVVGPHDNDQIGIGKHGIDHIHFQHVFVIHICFGQQHVHVSGHASGHGMNGVINPGPSGLQRVGQLLDLVLGLGQSHAVTGHDDHPLGGGQQPGHVRILLRRGLRGLYGLRRLGRGRLGRRAARTGHRGLTQQDGRQRAVHGLAHDAREHQTGGPHNAAHRDEQGVRHGEARDGAGNAAHGVKQRNGDGHVRAAHTDGKDDAEQRAGGEHDEDEQRGQEIGRNIVNAQGHQHDAQQDIDDSAVVGEHDGPLRQQLVQLARGHKGTGDGRHAGAERQTGVNAVKKRGDAHIREHDDADQRRRAAAKAVQKGHELGHLDHLDLVGQEEAEGRAQRYGCPQRGRAERIILVHGDENGAGHGDGGKNIAAHGRFDVAHQVQAVQDGQGQYHGDDVIQ